MLRAEMFKMWKPYDKKELKIEEGVERFGIQERGKSRRSKRFCQIVDLLVLPFWMLDGFANKVKTF